MAGLLVLLALAMLLRVSRIWWGLPYPVRWDEPFVINAGLRIVATGNWRPEPDTYVYGTLPIYASALASGLAFVLDAGKGLVTMPADYAAVSPYTPYSPAFALTTAAPSAYAAARLLAAVFGVVSVAMVYLAGRHLRLGVASLFGAALVAVSELHLYASSVAIVDGPAVMFMTVSLVAALSIVGGSTTAASYVVCGAACGLAIASKSNLAVCVLLLPVAFLLGPSRDRRALRHLLIGLVTVPAAFLAVEPYAILDFSNFLYGLGLNAYHYGSVGHEGANVQAGLPALCRYLAEIRPMIGDLGVVAAMAGVAVLGVTRPRCCALVLILGATYVLVMSRFRVYFPRNALPLLPLTAVFASAGLHGLIRALPSRWALAAGTAVAAAAAGPALIREAEVSRTMFADVDTREQVVRWLKGEAQTGAIVATDHDLPFHAPSFVKAGLAMVRLEPGDDGCSDGRSGAAYVVTAGRRDCAARLTLAAEFPGQALTSGPLSNPGVLLYRVVDGTEWQLPEAVDVDELNRPTFPASPGDGRPYRQLVTNGVATFGPIIADGGSLEVQLAAAGTIGDGRAPVVHVALYGPAIPAPPPQQAVALSESATAYSLTFVVPGSGTYYVQVVFDDDFYAPGRGDRNVRLYRLGVRRGRGLR